MNQPSIMNKPITLYTLLLDLSVEDDRVYSILKNAIPGKDFIRSVGLDGAAQRSARNDALVRASDFLVTETCQPTLRAKELSRAVVRFRQYIWPRLKSGVQLELLPHEVWLKRAFLADEHVPSSWVYLYESLFK